MIHVDYLTDDQKKQIVKKLCKMYVKAAFFSEYVYQIGNDAVYLHPFGYDALFGMAADRQSWFPSYGDYFKRPLNKKEIFVNGICFYAIFSEQDKGYTPPRDGEEEEEKLPFEPEEGELDEAVSD